MPRHLHPSEVAAMLGISVSQLRKPFYSRLSGLRRTKGGQRRFRDTKAFRSDIEALARKRQMRRTRATEKIRRRNFRSQAAWATGDKILAWVASRTAAQPSSTADMLIGLYSRMEGNSRDWVRARYSTAKRFKAKDRVPGLLWDHHRIAARLRNAATWLQRARSENWGPRRFRSELQRAGMLGGA